VRDIGGSGKGCPPPYVFLGGGSGDWKGPALCIFGGLSPKSEGNAARCLRPSLCETGSHVACAVCEIGSCVARGSE